MTAPTPLIAGNWKMNGLAGALGEAVAVAAGIGATTARVAICPPATLISRLSQALAGSKVEVGGQDCRSEPSGAFTGDVAAEMLVEAGASLVILGHSERRAGYGEPIVCVGETLGQRKGGEALAVVTGQVRGSLPAELAGKAFSVAYEPVWAIGTGLTPTTAEIEEMHRAIRDTLSEMFAAAAARVPILYGGSVKPSNAAEILHAAEVGGALVGGASLKADDFLGIIRAL
jgi:triosephosphate isomerase